MTTSHLAREDANPADFGNASAARWGRAAMASFFVVSAAVGVATHGDSWARIALGAATPLDWIYAFAAAAGILSGALFAAGRATVGIAGMWIGYCLIQAVGVYPFWSVPAQAVADTATGFLSHLAVAGSLMLYISMAERRR